VNYFGILVDREALLNFFISLVQENGCGSTMTTNSNKPWQIEQEYINNIFESATFVYIRGRRGVGKASLARRELEIHQKPHIFISVNDEKFEEKLKNEVRCLED
jgi:ABC-type transport system involved in cytochrome c biogenesis ATPase subunit